MCIHEGGAKERFSRSYSIMEIDLGLGMLVSADGRIVCVRSMEASAQVVHL